MTGITERIEKELAGIRAEQEQTQEEQSRQKQRELEIEKGKQEKDAATIETCNRILEMLGVHAMLEEINRNFLNGSETPKATTGTVNYVTHHQTGSDWNTFEKIESPYSFVAITLKLPKNNIGVALYPLGMDEFAIEVREGMVSDETFINPRSIELKVQFKSLLANAAYQESLRNSVLQALAEQTAKRLA